MKTHFKTLLTFLLITVMSSLVAQDLVNFEGANGKVGFKDKNDNVVIAPKYDRVGRFSYGYAWVELNWKKGFIDQTGKEITPLKYLPTDQGFSQIGIAPVAIKINQSDEITSGLIILKWGFIDKTGKEITPLKYDHVNEIPSREIIDVCVGCKWNNGSCKGGTWGFIDKLGNEVIPLIYEQVGVLS